MRPTKCWSSTPAIGNLIRENKTFRINSAIQTGAKQGMQLLDDHLFKLWQEKQVTKEEILIKANQLEELQKRVANAERGMFDDEADVERRARQMEKGDEGEGPKKKSA